MAVPEQPSGAVRDSALSQPLRRARPPAHPAMKKGSVSQLRPAAGLFARVIPLPWHGTAGQPRVASARDSSDATTPPLPPHGDGSRSAATTRQVLSPPGHPAGNKDPTNELWRKTESLMPLSEPSPAVPAQCHPTGRRGHPAPHFTAPFYSSSSHGSAWMLPAALFIPALLILGSQRGEPAGRR